jgi:hypothetical protein
MASFFCILEIAIPSMKQLFCISIFLLLSMAVNASAPDSTTQRKQDYQIFLKQPVKSIKLLMYEKNFLPIKGRISEDKKSVIISDYESGSKVHVKVEYEDGSIDEFVKSPCYIDPLVL